MPEVSVVILTMGDRPDELARAIESVRRQREVAVEIVVVGNGVDVGPEVDADVRLALNENVGIPEGRNRGAAVVGAPLICFLDDDGALVGDGVLAAVADRFDADGELGAVGLGIVDDTGETSRRHQPGIGSSGSGPATSFPGGGCVIRRTAFDVVDRWCGPFFYALEETDLAWRLLDAGWDVRFEPTLRMHHPRTSPTRHPSHAERTGRNRVWMAHRLLPLPLAVLYVVDWTVVTVFRNLRRPALISGHLRGTVTGLRSLIGPRRPIRWSTVRELARRGRPPII